MEPSNINEEQNLQELDETLRDLDSTEMGRRVFLTALPLLLTACATGPKSRYREGDNTGQQAKLTVEEEKRMTSEVLPKMRKDYPPIQDPALQSYVSTLGSDRVRANGLNGKPYNYTFTAVDVPYVNAFALPAGTVFITAPLMSSIPRSSAAGFFIFQAISYGRASRQGSGRLKNGDIGHFS